MLQDRLVCGLKHERIQQCLLGEGDLLTLEKKDWYSASHGVTIKQSLLIRSTEGVEEHLESIHKVQGKGKLICYRCAGKHLSQNYLLKDKKCFFCHKKGYIMKVCKVKKKNISIQKKANLVQEAYPC